MESEPTTERRESVRRPGWAFLVGLITIAGSLLWAAGLGLWFWFSSENDSMKAAATDILLPAGAAAWLVLGTWGTRVIWTGRNVRRWATALFWVLGLGVVVGVSTQLLVPS